MTFVAAPQWAVHSYTTRGRIYKHTQTHTHIRTHQSTRILIDNP